LSRQYVVSCFCAAAFVVGQTSASEAFALQRMAAAVDMSHVAASGSVTIPASGLAVNVPSRLVVPPSIDLLGPTTELRVGIPIECDVTIEVADDAGAPLFLAEVHMPAGWQKIGFSGRDALGNPLANGTYYYTLTADGTSRTMRVVVNR
jgi:hypothetical protein